ncbi:MAG: DUF333 domain-containing protein [Candidatus Aenigmatarchaeota archaeon]
MNMFIKNNQIIFIKIILTILLFLSTLKNAYALRNPAAVYCTAMGYEYINEKTPEGDIGYCILPNKEKIEAWEFLTGKKGIEFSYCKKIGLEVEIVESLTDCYITDVCIMCVFPNGTKIDMIKLMNLSFEETICGDGNCGFPENYFNCPEDCPSGSYDGICDGIQDNRCDPDCIYLNVQNADPDCVESKPKRFCLNIKDGICDENCIDDPDCEIEPTRFPIWILFIIIIVISFFLFVYYYKKIRYIKKV